MSIFYDQLNREVILPDTPQRIVSIVPSQTELLFYLGFNEQIVGITSFCIHPAAQVKPVTKVGGTKKLNIALIKQLKPDLIIANKEENERGQVEELMQFCPVWISDINNLPGAIDMIERIGQMLNRNTQTTELSKHIQLRFGEIEKISIKLRVAYLIWRKPYMAAGNDTFINNMLQLCGLTNVFNISRYPEITPAMFVKAKPDVVLLSSEPYPFSEKHIIEIKALLPQSKIILVDGEMFSWYGSRLLQAPAYFSSVIETLTAG
jgi:ABC-type Fe3+-hydroxamate transport system substrate-binding protein